MRLREIYVKWVALENIRLGWSPTAELGTDKCPFIDRYDQPHYAKNKRDRRKFDAIAVARWLDDGGPDGPSY